MAQRNQSIQGAAIAAICGLSLSLPSGVIAQSRSGDDLLRLLDQGSCKNCKLQDSDLVHADLRDAELVNAQLQRSNLSRSRLDGADLRQANLSFASLLGASLRGADLRGANLEGADLREADLSGAKLDPNALASSHWKGATGVSAEASSYASMHNAGVEAAQQGRLLEAEDYFNRALLKNPDAAITWLARGITRSQQAKLQPAQQDITYAAALFEQQGDTATALQLREQLKQLERKEKKQAGNGLGSGFLRTAGALFQQLAPLAMKMFAPTPF
jgi:tetratricopeptide (TPR) repeat protein